jgi:hypothetical protein
MQEIVTRVESNQMFEALLATFLMDADATEVIFRQPFEEAKVGPS